VIESVGIRSLAVRFPNTIRTNDYWREKTPELVTSSKRRTRTDRPIELTANASGLEIWSQAVAPYLSDPFRGSVERRVLDDRESSFALEHSVAQDAITAANLTPADIDLLIVTSIFPEQVGFRDASYLVDQLSLQCPAWNLESTCSSAAIALQTAAALVRTHEYQHVLVVVSHVGSNAINLTDTLSWSIGDGSGAFVVTTLKSEQGILGSKIVHTAATRGAHAYDWVMESDRPRLCMRTGENAAALAETAVDYVRICCEGAAAAAGVTLDRIDFFAFNTPTAWYAQVCSQALRIDFDRTINLYPYYANIGPVFPIANLYHAVQIGKLRENQLALVYTIGAAATAAATVMRWGEIGLGPAPAPPKTLIQTGDRVILADYISCSRDVLFATAPAARQQRLETYLTQWLTQTLTLSSPTIAQQPLASMLDSLTILALRGKVEADLQVRVPMTQFFGDRTISELAAYVLNQLAIADLVTSTSNTSISDSERERLSL